MKSLCIDLFCGLGGWTEGFLAEGYDCIGFDIERHDYGTGGYPGQLVLQDILTLHGSQFRNADMIVASPPCQEYSYMAMPWSLAKAKAAHYRANPELIESRLNVLFRACFRIQREACEAAGRHIPMVVENVRGAQPWVGYAAWNFGSFYLWGDVPALMPSNKALKNNGGSWFAIGSPGQKVTGQNPDGRKVPGMNFHDHAKTGRPGRLFQSAAVKVASDSGRSTDVGNGARFTSRDCGIEKGFAKEWRDSPNGMPMMSSKSPARKAASAQIAKIPLPLSRWIAQTYKPQELAA